MSHGGNETTQYDLFLSKDRNKYNWLKSEDVNMKLVRFGIGGSEHTSEVPL